MIVLSVVLSLAAHAQALDETAARGRDDDRPRNEHREALLRAHRALSYTTAAALTVTAAGGLVALANQPTLLGEGRCASGNPIFGDYGCEGFSILHGMGGVLTT